MNHTGVRSTGSRRHARRNRSFDGADLTVPAYGGLANARRARTNGRRPARTIDRMDQERVLGEVLSWAERENGIRLVVVTGSVARGAEHVDPSRTRTSSSRPAIRTHRSLGFIHDAPRERTPSDSPMSSASGGGLRSHPRLCPKPTRSRVCELLRAGPERQARVRKDLADGPHDI